MTGVQFDYKDGGEQRLADLFLPENEHILAQQRANPEDWALKYHLSPLRANLMRSLPWSCSQPIDILEVGAGCGAITEYLLSVGRNVNVTALEGAPARAKVIELRCGQHENLRVVNANAMDFDEDRTFDVVTLIGVLEYSGKYVAGPDPFLHLLTHLKQFCKPNGRLILAIENQLGHKYLAGANEDHYGRRFIGVDDYLEYNGIRTFDKASLKQLLESAGFLYQRWMYPFPDYKLPRVVLTSEAFEDRQFDWLSILDLPSTVEDHSFDPQFNERSFLRNICRNVDPGVFMNSFLVEASMQPLPSRNFLAVKYNAERAEEFRCSKTFCRSENGELSVVSDNFGATASKCDKYLANCENLHLALLDASLRVHVDTIQLLVTLWREALQASYVHADAAMRARFDECCIKQLGSASNMTAEHWVSGASIDLIPRNILVSQQRDQFAVIDLEWTMPCVLPATVLVSRGIKELVSSIVQHGGHLMESRLAALDSLLNDTFGTEKVDCITGKPQPWYCDSFEWWLRDLSLGREHSGTNRLTEDRGRVPQMNGHGRSRVGKLLRRGLQLIGRIKYVRKAAEAVLDADT